MIELLKMDVKSSYTQLRYYKDSDQYLLRNEVSGELCVKKHLEHYEESVFEYLKVHNEPHIPRVIEYGYDGEGFYVIEEYIEGRTLDKYLTRSSADNDERRRILYEILDGVEFLHSARPQIVHRDLKPENIMIDKSGLVKIIDFDAAKTFKPGRSRDTELIGTQGMAAPEQYGFAQSDCRTDIFALGKIIKTLFPNDAGMIPVIRKATKIDPDQRYSSIRELRRDLARTGKAPVWLGENGFKIVAIAIAAAAVILFAVATIKLFRIADRLTESSVVYLSESTSANDSSVQSEGSETDKTEESAETGTYEKHTSSQTFQTKSDINGTTTSTEKEGTEETTKKPTEKRPERTTEPTPAPTDPPPPETTVETSAPETSVPETTPPETTKASETGQQGSVISRIVKESSTESQESSSSGDDAGENG